MAQRDPGSIVLRLWRGLMPLALLGLAACAGGPQPDSRTLVLHHAGSGEEAAATYFANGRYDRRALFQFSMLLRDRHSNQITDIDPRLIDLLHDLPLRLGLPESTPVEVTSGYRSELTNASLSRSNPNVAERSYHIRGQAADIHIAGVAPEALARAAASLHRGGYAWYPRTGHVHVDVGPVRTWHPE
ncbi:MAG: DUF882 domain-containing protein [Rhodospirillaceae bacterium]